MPDLFGDMNSRRSAPSIPLRRRIASAVKALWRNKLWILALMIAAAAAFICCNRLISAQTASATLELLYEQAYEGLNPNGTRFNIYELLSDAVLDRTIERAGLAGELSREELLSSLRVRPSGSQDPGDMYIATEYGISLNGRKLPRGAAAGTVLELLMDTYKEYFLDHYGTNDSALDIDWSDADGWEYLEFAQFIDVKSSGLITYLDGLRTESGMSQYRIDGESCRSLSESVVSFRDIYLDRFVSYVTVNRLFRDPAAYGSELEYQRFLTEQDMKSSRELYAIYQDALKMYDESMITYVMVPMYDSTNGLYMARTSIGMDSLTERSEECVEDLEASSKELKELDRRLEAASNAGTDREKHEAAERMIAEIRQHMEDLIARVRTVKNDYEDYRSRTSIRYAVATPGWISGRSLKGAAASAIGVFALFAVIFAVRGDRRRERAS